MDERSANVHRFKIKGKSETEILDVYAPWAKVRWTEAGRKCVFYCGVNLPPNLHLDIERHDNLRAERQLRTGDVVFRDTPEELKTW